MFLLVIVTFYFLLFTDFFHIKEITIEGNNMVANDEIITKLGINLEDNIFMFNRRSVIKSLQAIPYVKEARLLRLFPNKLVINIEEREPVAIFYFNTKFLYVDGNEIVTDYTDKLYYNDIPLITSVTEHIDSIEMGSSISIEPQWIKKNIFKIVNDFDEYQLLKYISEINITKDNLFYIYSKGGSIIKVKNSDILHDKIELISTYLQGKDDRMIIDLTHGGNPTYIPR